MPRGSKSKYTSKQKRQAHHIEQSAKRRGHSAKRAAQIGYATVNKQDGGGKKSGSGRGKHRSTASSRAGGRASHSRGRSTRGGSRAAHARAGRAAHR
ncbi:MAG: plasmid stabilization protein [Kofleriaceae bacterium]